MQQQIGKDFTGLTSGCKYPHPRSGRKYPLKKCPKCGRLGLLAKYKTNEGFPYSHYLHVYKSRIVGANAGLALNDVTGSQECSVPIPVKPESPIALTFNQLTGALKDSEGNTILILRWRLNHNRHTIGQIQATIDRIVGK